MKKWKIFYFITLAISVFVGETYYSGSMNYFFVKTLGMSVKTQALLWSLFIPVSIIILITTSIISDRHIDKKEGRRIPFLRLFGIIEGLVFALIYIIPSAFSKEIIIVFYFLGLIVLEISSDIVEGALFAIPSEEIRDKKKRTNFYIIMGLLSIFIEIIQIYITSSMQVDEFDNPLLFRSIMFAFGMFLSISTIIASNRIPHEYKVDENTIKNSHPIKSYLACLKNKKFLIGEIYLTLTVSASYVLIFGFYYYNDEVNRFDYIDFIFVILFGIFANFIYKYLEDKLEKKYIYALYSFISFIGFVISFLLGTTRLALIVCFFSCAFSLYIQYAFNYLIIVEAVDDHEKKSNTRKEAQYLSIDYLFDSLGTFGNTIFLMIIIFFGYVDGVENTIQSSSAKLGISIGFLLLPATLLFFATIAMLFYPKD